MRRRWVQAVLLLGGAALAVGLPTAASSTIVSFRIVGVSKSMPSSIDGPCPEGEWSTALYAVSRPARIGTAYGCGLSISKRDQPGYGVRWIKQRARVTYILPGGTIRTIESQTFDFARDQHHSRLTARGRIVKGTGRYAQVHGTVRVEGSAVDGRASYRLWT
jgi:hypothetical protein